LKDVRFVSLRFLIPELEASVLSPNHRPVDVLDQCFGFDLDVNGRRAPVEYYFVPRGNFLPNNLDPEVFWDDDSWRIPCPRRITFTRGLNPCQAVDNPTPVPDDWEEPVIAVSSGTCGEDVLAADVDGGDLWWY